jgi:hypothetical protein
LPVILAASSQVPHAAASMAPKTMKSVSSQFTPFVNRIATKGSGNRNAAVPQTAILQRLPRRPPPFSVFSAIALALYLREAFNLA